jgi:hypothetical protein
MKVGDLGLFSGSGEIFEVWRKQLFTITKMDESEGWVQVMLLIDGSTWFFSVSEMAYIAEFLQTDNKCPRQK